MSERKWDDYCWRCHKPTNDEVNCSNCNISYHNNCIADLNRNSADWKCPQCRLAETHEKGSLNDNELDELLKYCVERVSRRLGTFMLPNDYKTNKQLINPITFEDILNNIKNGEYSSVSNFLLDIEWILHNCYIMRKHCEKETKKLYAEKLEKAKLLFKHCEDEVYELRLCGDCYIRREQEDAFTMVCSQPHLVLWVKYHTYPYWPAKLLKIRDRGRKPLEVYFFKEHNTAQVSCDDCFLYSEKDPNVYCSKQGLDKNKTDVDSAVEEAKKYIQNIEEIFGKFCFAPMFTKPIASKLDNLHLDQMIPGFRSPDQRRLHNENSKLESVQPNDNDIVDFNLGQEPEMMQTNEDVPNEVVPVTASQRPIIPLSKTFLEKVKQCHEYVVQLKKEYQLQKDTINQLQTELESMKEQVTHAKLHKWCKNCLKLIKAENALEYCEECSILH